MLGEGSVSQVYPQLCLLIILRQSLIILIIQATLNLSLLTPASVSQVARIAGLYQQAWLILLFVLQ